MGERGFMAQNAPDKARRNDGAQLFRPEAVEAYTTRQAGEPWDAKHRWEGLLIAALSVAAVGALTFIFLGGH